MQARRLMGFNGTMDGKSVQATIYNYFQYFFYRSLFDKYTVKGLTEQFKIDPEDGKPYWSTKRQL